MVDLGTNWDPFLNMNCLNKFWILSDENSPTLGRDQRSYNQFELLQVIYDRDLRKEWRRGERKREG